MIFHLKTIQKPAQAHNKIRGLSSTLPLYSDSP